MDRKASTLGPGMDMPIMHDSDRYELMKDIGAGNFGIERLMRDRQSKELVAVKYIERGAKIDENVHREIINHRSLRHPNIIKFKEVILTPTHLAIVMEYASGGELFERICNAGKFSEDEARFFFQQLISGVSYCHSMGPLAAPVLQLPTKDDLSKFNFSEFRELDINGAKCFLTRTGSRLAHWGKNKQIAYDDTSWEKTVDCYSPGQGLIPASSKISSVPSDGGNEAFEQILDLDFEESAIGHVAAVNSVMHDMNLIHTDLKPENILFLSPKYIKVSDHKFNKAGSSSLRLPKSSAIKIIDFGSITNDSQDHSYTVSTRHYRAPEVILGLGWSYPCDIWSVGCILVELCTGDALFQTYENLEHLAMMERVLGHIPQHLLRKANRHAEKYFRRGRLNWPDGASSRDGVKAVSKLSRLESIILWNVDHSAGDLIDLLEGLLDYEPSKRLTAHEALKHPFFTRSSHSRS